MGQLDQYGQQMNNQGENLFKEGLHMMENHGPGGLR